MLRKLLLVFLGILITTNICAADINDWIRGDGSDVVEGDESPSDIDDMITNYLQNPLDKLLDGYLKGCTGTITSDTVYTVSAGKVCCENAAGTVHRMRENTSTTTVTNTSSGVGGLDTGSLAADKWYYIYAVADADATTFTAIMSESAVNPTNANALYYKLIGCALTDSSSDWLPYFWSGNGNDVTVMWDVPMNEATAASASAWSSAIDCSSSMPSISTLGIFGLEAYENAAASAGVWIRPNGSTWSTNKSNGVWIGYSDTPAQVTGQRMCATDSSQQIQYYNGASDTSTRVDVEGFQFVR